MVLVKLNKRAAIGKKMQDKFLKIGWIWMVLVGIQRIFGGIMLVAMEVKDLKESGSYLSLF